MIRPMDNLDKKLTNHFKEIKVQDSASVPAFETMMPAPAQQKKRRIPFFLKVAASMILVVSASWLYWLNTQNNELLISSNTITEGLLQEPAYLWNWESPTQHLLSPIEFELKKIEK